jgi:type 1 glutamine amidotransferase
LGHPAAPQFQQATVVVDDPNSPITAGLGTRWAMTEEWYSFKTNPRATGAHILVTLDESTYKPISMEGDLHMGDHPIAWTRCVGRGRSFYTAIGHLPQSYTQPSAALLLSRGIEWAATGGKAGCTAAAKRG